MAVLFAFVVILGKQVQDGGLPFVMLALRFAGQSLLLIGLLAVYRPEAPACQGRASPPRPGRHHRIRVRGRPLLLGAQPRQRRGRDPALLHLPGVGDAADHRARPEGAAWVAVRRARPGAPGERDRGAGRRQRGYHDPGDRAGPRHVVRVHGLLGEHRPSCEANGAAHGGRLAGGRRRNRERRLRRCVRGAAAAPQPGSTWQAAPR